MGQTGHTKFFFDGTYINVNLSNTGTSGTMILVSNTAAPIGSWFHIGVTSVVNGVRALYQNGVVVYAFNYSTIGALYNNAIPFRLGAYSTPSIFLDGRMSCVSIWNNRTLSTPDIVAIYNSGTPREYADLTTAEKVDMVSFWHLNEPSGTRYDAHGSNDLTDNNTVVLLLDRLSIQPLRTLLLLSGRTKRGMLLPTPTAREPPHLIPHTYLEGYPDLLERPDLQSLELH